MRSRPGEQGCRSTLGSTTAIRAKENGGGGSSELTREGKLIVSILIDLIGMSTYLLPVAGEGADVIAEPTTRLPPLNSVARHASLPRIEPETPPSPIGLPEDFL